MKQYNRIIAVMILLWVAIAGISSAFTYKSSFYEADKGYKIDINRSEAMLAGGGRPEDIKSAEYEYIKWADYILLPCSNGELKDFFSGKDVSKVFEFQIQPMFEKDQLKGYIRYAYAPDKQINAVRFLVFINICFFIFVSVAVAVLIYIKHNIIGPFNEIAQLPFELSKGHLKSGLKESKNRYFGKFLWGLELLRENLEEHKRKELLLEKDKKTMILSISHDIKTPLSTIKLYSKAIYDNMYRSEEKKMEAARHIEEKAHQIEGFVRELIATSTEDIFNIQVSSEDFYLKELMDKVNKTYAEKLRLMMTGFSTENFENVLLKGDLERLLEVFENIIENAIKYGDGKYIKITFSDEDYCKLITVTNSGPPLPDTQFVHMFESFWRGGNAHGKSGSGLGLYICKEIMKKMDGDIFAGSTGNTMSFTVVVRYS